MSLRLLRLGLTSLLVLVGGSQAWSAEAIRGSLPSLRLATEERIVGFEVRTKNALVRAIEPIPLGWHLTIDNDPSWNGSILASAKVGAAALDSSELGGITLWLEAMGEVGIEADIHITKNFESTRIVRVGTDQFNLRRPK